MVPEFLECPLCMEPFTKVVETTCCHRCYCSDCLTQWLIKPNNKTCPGCRAKLESVDNCVPNIPFQRLVNDLPAKCTFSDKGCKDKITRGIVEEHIKACDYRTVICEYGKDQCPTLLKKDLTEHLKICSWRPFTCPLCSLNIVFHELKSHNSTKCPMAKIPCTNTECRDETITREKLEDHLENHCSYQTIPCPFSTYLRCTFKNFRGMMDAHLQEFALDHLKNSFLLLKKKDLSHKKLLEKVDELQKENLELSFGIEQLSVLKPQLDHSPLSKFNVVLPSCLSDHTSKLAYISGDNRNKAGIKSKTGSFFFGSSEPPHVAIITAERHVPLSLDKFDIPYYFEMTVKKNPQGEDSGNLSIGLFGEGDSMNEPLGFGNHSYGFNISQNKYWSSGKSKTNHISNDNLLVGTYGCGWDQKNQSIFFTLQGRYGGTVFENVRGGRLKPAICLSNPGTEVQVNFGTSKFVFDVLIWKEVRNFEIKFKECEKMGLCSFVATRVNYYPQLMFGCKTCGLVGNLGMCEMCSQVCHVGHDIIPPRMADFFCDCGHITEEKKRELCKCLKIRDGFSK